MRHDTQPTNVDKSCATHPSFAVNAEGKAKSVTLKPENYIKLLVDARETDPACWPPGMEEVAAMVARVQEIENVCVEKHGDFDPEKLSSDVQDEYMEINLVLDAISEGESAAEALTATSTQTAPVAPTVATTPANTQASSVHSTCATILSATDSWEDFPHMDDRENFA
jgi:hypothetical protein